MSTYGGRMLSAALDLGIDLDVWPWIWLVTAVVFALVELIVVGGSFVILPWSLSAFIAAVLAFYDVSIEIQWAVFTFGGAALFALMYRWAQRFMKEHPINPGVGADRLVGLVGTVTTPVDPDDTDRRGRITVEGEVWGVVDAVRAYAAGEKVRVVAMKGTRVVIESAGGSAGTDEGGIPR
jgi:membrane protein implicated in regulation of membrane protease activity